jgi:8-oxo-dGTP pyrophosphatase MutT (NUDIX family)
MRSESTLRPHDTTERLRELLGKGAGVNAGAAVAVLLRRDVDDLRVLLVKRAVNPSDPWSGDIALPGGRPHPEDRGLRDTVIRETMEETGIDLRICDLLGTLDPVNSNVDPVMVVLPFVAVCDGVPAVTLSGELCSHFWVSIGELRHSRGMARVRQREVPAFLVNGEVVWGLTYRMLEKLLELIDEASLG